MLAGNPAGQNIRIGVISDTHARSFAELPQALVSSLAACNLIIHAGDVISLDVIRGLESLAPLHAVHGNMCQPDVWSKLADKLILEVSGRKIGITHGSGGPEEAWLRVQRIFEGVDVIVFGHTHEPMNKVVNGVLLFNPGRASRSYGLLEIGTDIKGSIKLDYF